MIGTTYILKQAACAANANTQKEPLT
jgi:hypothetical protein